MHLNMLNMRYNAWKLFEHSKMYIFVKNAYKCMYLRLNGYQRGVYDG